ncbi:MAG: hypothetical protein KJO66_00790 [Gammaproteobacteria bacterium]|jgi:hypothetical protein|nr:hypothetical protein [Gammaproteobacteria bacterium]
MFLQQKPIPGYWYSNQSGQLIQVRAIVFSGGKGNRIVIEDISGKRESLDMACWRDMDLVLHSPVSDHRQDDAARDF